MFRSDSRELLSLRRETYSKEDVIILHKNFMNMGIVTKFQSSKKFR